MKKKAAADGFDAVEVARKRRHLYLLSKVRDNKNLRPAELEELKEYEEMAKRGKDKKTEHDKSPPAVFKTRKAAAEYADVSIRTISNWAKNDTSNILRNDKGHYIRASIDKFVKNGGVEEGPKFKKLTAEAGFKDVKRKLAEIDLAEKEGRLISIDEVKQGRLARIQAVKRALLGMGRKLAKQLAAEKNPRKVQAIINKEARAIINGFAGEKIV